MEYVLTATKTEAKAGSYYDKIWRLYDLTFKLNGYGRSLDEYFASHPPPVSMRPPLPSSRRRSALLRPSPLLLHPRSTAPSIRPSNLLPSPRSAGSPRSGAISVEL